MREINPKETTRAYAFEMWMQAPNPMVTFFKTLNVSRLVKASKRAGLKFNMLMCYCIGKAASQVKEFYMLPVGDKPTGRSGRSRTTQVSPPTEQQRMPPSAVDKEP